MAKWHGDKGWYVRMMGIAKAKGRIGRMTAEFGHAFPDAFVRGGAVMARRAKQIINEKGHVVSGTLMGSIHSEITDWRKEYIEVSVGTWVHYARKIEDLPDGGYLFQAFEETRTDVLKYIDNQLKRIVKRNAGL